MIASVSAWNLNADNKMAWPVHKMRNRPAVVQLTGLGSISGESSSAIL